MEHEQGGVADPPAAEPLTRSDLSPLVSDQSPSTSSSDVLVQQLITKCSSIPPEQLVEYLVDAGSTHVNKAAAATTETETHLRSILLLDRLAQSALPPPSLERWKAFLSEQSIIEADHSTHARLKEDWRDEAEKGENEYEGLLRRIKRIIEQYTPWDNLEGVPWEGVRWSLTINFVRSVLSLFAVICNLGPLDVVKEPRPPHHLIKSRLAEVIKRAKGTSDGWGRKGLVSALQELRPVYRAHPAQDPPPVADANVAPSAAKPKRPPKQKKQPPPPRSPGALRNRTNDGSFAGMTAPTKKRAAPGVRPKKPAEEEGAKESGDENAAEQDEEGGEVNELDERADGGAELSASQVDDEGEGASGAMEGGQLNDEPVGAKGEAEQEDGVDYTRLYFVTAAEISVLTDKRTMLVHDLAKLCRTQERIIADLINVDSQLSYFSRGEIDRLLPADVNDPVSLKENALAVRFQIDGAKKTDRQRRKADLRGEGVFSTDHQDDALRTPDQYIDSNTDGVDQDAAAVPNDQEPPPKRRRLDLATPFDDLDIIEAYNFAARRDAFVDLDEHEDALVGGPADGDAHSPDVSPAQQDSPVNTQANPSSRASTPAPSSSRAVTPSHRSSPRDRSVRRVPSPAPPARSSPSPEPAPDPSRLPDHLTRLAFFGDQKPGLNNTVAEMILDVFMVSDSMIGLHGMLEKEEKSEADLCGGEEDDEDEQMSDVWDRDDAGGAIDWWVDDAPLFDEDELLRAQNRRSWTSDAYDFLIARLEQRLAKVRESGPARQAEYWQRMEAFILRNYAEDALRSERAISKVRGG